MPDTLSDLIAQAESATQTMSQHNPNRQLLFRLSMVAVGLARRVAELEAAQVEKPLIVPFSQIPGQDVALNPPIITTT